MYVCMSECMRGCVGVSMYFACMHINMHAYVHVCILIFLPAYVHSRASTKSTYFTHFTYVKGFRLSTIHIILTDLQKYVF